MAKKIPMSGLSDIVSEIISESRKPGEFTCREFLDECLKMGREITMDSASKKLKRQVSGGFLLSRKTNVDGCLTNLYRKP